MPRSTRRAAALLFVALAACSAGRDGEPAAAPALPADASSPALDAATRLAQYPEAPHEARDGDLWIGTAFEGLLRYDGETFTTYTTADGLAGDTVRGVHEDEDGTLWFATTGGLSRWDGERFTTLADYAIDEVTRTFGELGDHRDLWHVTRDSAGRLWIATQGGAFRLEGDTFVPFPLDAQALPHEHEFTPRMVYHVFEDRGGALWFATDGAGLVRVADGAQRAFTTADGLASDHVTVVAQAADGTYWLGTSDGGVRHFDGDAFTTHLRNAERSIHVGWGRFLSVLVDRRGVAWFGRSSPGGGVHRHAGGAVDAASFELLSVDAGLGDGGVIALREDRSGHLWVGSTTGVFRLDEGGRRFVELTPQGFRAEPAAR
jgi:ligand-binding sensor domain-containing protein